MIVYKITANGVTHYTKTGISIWKAVLDKFDIEYEIVRQNHIDKNDNDIPHSDIRRMESEGVYEEKFQRNSSNNPNSNHTYFQDEWNQDITEDIEIKYIQSLDWREEILKREFGGNSLKKDDDVEL